MATCEKCWRDSRGDPTGYRLLLLERNANGEVCSPEEQAGEDAKPCPECCTRTVHQHAGICMNCGEEYVDE